eukprot:Lithocolla_globosa_v1_NODE_3186_length_1738_cov_3.635769.p1 type:complete len:387 gc:universal NODE_3186_length_1738_cov_3.635769:1172-12(-)
MTVTDISTHKSLGSYSIFELIPQWEKVYMTNSSVSSFKEFNKAVGAMVGMAIGDHLGNMLSGLPVVDQPGVSGFMLSSSDLNFTQQSNPFSLKPGQYTDATSMGLCVADSLTVTRGYDGSDIRIRFHNWWFHQYNNGFKTDSSRTSSIGVGHQTFRSIYTIPTNSIPTTRFETDMMMSSNDAGISPLLRIAPIPIFYHQNLDLALRFGKESCFTTHPGENVVEAAAFVCYLMVSALNCDYDPSSNIQEFLSQHVNLYLERLVGNSKAVNDLRKLLRSSETHDSCERTWNWKSETLNLQQTISRRNWQYNGYPVSSPTYGSFSLDGLAIALSSLYHTTTFEGAISRCVNFLGDAGSQGALVGQIGGVIYGYGNIPKKWLYDKVKTKL